MTRRSGRSRAGPAGAAAPGPAALSGGVRHGARRRVVLSCGLDARCPRSAPDGRTTDGHGMPLGRSTGRSVQHGEYWRVLGMVFEHGGPLHLLFNMSVVWTLGITLERAIGSLALPGCRSSPRWARPSSPCFFNFDACHGGRLGMILGWAGAMLPISTRAGPPRAWASGWCRWSSSACCPADELAGHLGGFLFGLPWAGAEAGPRALRARRAPPAVHRRGGGLVAAHPGARSSS